MLRLPNSLEKAINELNKLPGVGPKSAQRLVFYLLKQDGITLTALSQAIADLKKGVTLCAQCHNMTENNPCDICSNPQRDHNLICVVEESLDALALERTNQFKGTYHVLGGVINPLEGITPEKLNITSLITKVTNLKLTEIIIATNPTLEGETTALYIAKLCKDLPIKITRIARGLPMGGDLEYADEITLSRALEGRREVN